MGFLPELFSEPVYSGDILGDSLLESTERYARLTHAINVARYEMSPDEVKAAQKATVPSKSKPSKGSWKRIGGGASAFVAPDGTIKKGCPGLKGENVADLTDEDEESRDRRAAKQAHAEAKGIKGHEVTATAAKSWEGKGAQAQHQAAKQAAKVHGVPVADVLKRLPDAHKLRMEEWQRTETARAESRRMTGLNSANLGKIENAYRDYSSVPHFDEIATSFAMEHPEMGFGRSGDLSAELWDFIREGASPKPALHDPETASMAAEMAKRPAQAHSWESEDAGGWEPEESHAFHPHDAETVPFSRIRDAIDRYASKKSKPAKGQKELHWITLNGGDGEGTHVMVDGEGEIKAGPAGLEGKKLGGDNAKSSKSPSKKERSVNRKPDNWSHLLSSGDERGSQLTREAMADARQWRNRLGLPPAEHELAVVPLDSITPSQSGEDYDNPSSRELAKHIDEFGASGRWADYKPIIVDEKGKIIDGNHRHAARSMAGIETIPVIRPKKDQEGSEGAKLGMWKRETKEENAAPKPETAGQSWEKKEPKPKRSPDGPKSFADIRPEHTADIVEAIKSGRHSEASSKFDALMDQTKARQFEAHMLMQKLRDEAGIKQKTRAERKAEAQRSAEADSQKSAPIRPESAPSAPKTYKEALAQARKAAKSLDKRDDELRKAIHAGGQEAQNITLSKRRGKLDQEPHEMTAEEWANHYGGVTADELRSRIGQANDGTRAGDAATEHEAWMQKARQAGRPIPDNVTESYKPKPATNPAPQGIAGQQSSLFGGQDMRTGQKALFNVIAPEKRKTQTAAGLFSSITAGLDSAVKAKLAEKDTLSPADLSMTLQKPSIEGQREMFRKSQYSRITHAINSYLS